MSDNDAAGEEDATATDASDKDTTPPGDDASGDSSSGDDGGDAALDAASSDATVDATATEAGADASSDGASFDGNVACVGTGSACLYETDAGAGANGLCASNLCGPCVTKTDDALCNAAYAGDAGHPYICASATCVPGDCHTDGDCSGTTVACVGNTCTACDGVSNGIYYVDPVGGSNAVASTGSDTAGGQPRAQCAFKTISHALAMIGAPLASTKIIVLGPATVSAGETFPLSVPANVVIEGQGAVTVQVPSQQTTDAGVAAADGFVLGHSSSGLETLTVDGQSLGGAAGVLVTSGSAASTYLKNVTVENFAAGDGVQVTGSGVVTLEGGVKLTKNLVGLALSGTGNASSSNTDLANPVAFVQNTQDGVLVAGSASVSFAGVAGAIGAGSIVASQNGSGIVMSQTGPGVNMPPSALAGVVAWKNTLYGLDLQGGSRVAVRSSLSGGNAIGVYVRTSTVTASNDTSYIDLGTAADFGKNTLQSLAPGDGGPSAQNANAGACFAILPNSSQTLSAQGNVWVDAAGTAAIDCTASSPGALTVSAVCTGGVDVGGSGVQLTGGAGKNTVDVSHCSL
jgi:hypothetical protein